MIELRPMRWWDLEAVHALEVELFPVDCWSVEQFWSELAQPTRHYVVAVDDGNVVGYAGLFLLAPDSDVQTIAVSSTVQGRGLGAQLLTWLIETAMRGGGDQMLLEVRSDNAPAIALYERFGFECISARRDYYATGIDAHIMRLRPLAVAA